MELRNLEEREELKEDGQRISSFQREINKIFDKNLDESLDGFMKKHNFKISNNENIVYWLIKYTQFIKNTLK